MPLMPSLGLTLVSICACVRMRVEGSSTLTGWGAVRQGQPGLQTVLDTQVKVAFPRRGHLALGGPGQSSSTRCQYLV